MRYKIKTHAWHSVQSAYKINIRMGARVLRVGCISNGDDIIGN